MESSQKRLTILSEEDSVSIYRRPLFSEEEQFEYFNLSSSEQLIVDSFRTLKSRIYCTLQLGYFKVSQQFFVFALEEVLGDATYIQNKRYPNYVLTDLKLSKVTRLKQQKHILQHFGFRYCHETERMQLQKRVFQLARISSKPIYLFRELMHDLAEQKLILPAYSTMQDLIAAALNHEQTRLSDILEKNLSTVERKDLQHLLEADTGLHNVTQLKRQPKDFNPSSLKQEMRRAESLRGLYQLAQRLVHQLAISNENITFYASQIDHYTVYKLKRMESWTVYLYLLCFIHYRYQQLQDNLLKGFLHHLRRFDEAIKDAVKEKVAAYRLEANRNMVKAAKVLRLFTDTSIPRELPFYQLQDKAFALLEAESLELVATHIASKARFDERLFSWEAVDDLATKYKHYLRPSIHACQFAVAAGQADILQVIDFLRTSFEKDRSLAQIAAKRFPSQPLAKTQQRYLFERDDKGKYQPKVDRYEYQAYRFLAKGVEAGNIYCPNSIQYRSFEDDLISLKDWQQDKEAILADLALPLLEQPIKEQLADLKTQLEQRIIDVNARIQAGENQYFKQKPSGRWSLSYPSRDSGERHPFYDQLSHVDISQLLNFVNDCCPFLEVFDHGLSSFRLREQDSSALKAAVLAWGSNMGLGKMADISDLSFYDLRAVSDNFIRPETLAAANDLLTNALAAMPLFQAFNLGDKVHSSSDGQKFESQFDTYNARHSSKYFGLHKGVVAYSLVANHIPINAKVLAADEHESHYVFDLLFNNSSQLKPELHSTDTHGTNEVNFALLHMFGYQFAPRYKNIAQKTKKALYGFKQPGQYEGLILKPIRKLNEQHVIQEWDNVLRIFASLALKTTSQHIIVKKLSSFQRKNATKQALWEFDNIFRSIFLLDYIDDASFRRHIHTALNRGENYHQLRRAVSFANFGRLRFHTEYEQSLWSECSRLITNCILFYNCSLLTRLIQHKELMGDLAAAEQLKKTSPVAWQHINFMGRYEFNKTPEPIDLNLIIQKLT